MKPNTSSLLVKALLGAVIMFALAFAGCSDQAPPVDTTPDADVIDTYVIDNDTTPPEPECLNHDDCDEINGYLCESIQQECVFICICGGDEVCDDGHCVPKEIIAEECQAEFPELSVFVGSRLNCIFINNTGDQTGNQIRCDFEMFEYLDICGGKCLNRVGDPMWGSDAENIITTPDGMSAPFAGGILTVNCTQI